MDYSQGQPSPSQAAPAQPLPMVQLQPQPQYQVQGTQALAPQYQQPMAQILPMAQYQIPLPAQPQPVESRPSSTTQELTSLVRDLVGLRQTSAPPSPPQAAPSHLPPAVIPQAQPYMGQPQYQTGYPQTYSTNPGYSQDLRQDLPPASPHLTEHSLKLLGQLTTPDALDALNLIDSDIPASKAAIHAYAIEIEDRLNYVSGEYEKVAPLVEEGLILWELLSDPAKFGGLTEYYLNQMLRVPGGYDHLLQAFLPIYDQVTEYRRQQDAAARGQSRPQQQYQQPPQQQYQQPPQQQATNLPPTTYSWGDGGNPASREVDNGLPPQAGSRPTQLGNIPPDQRWRHIDAMQQDGSIRSIQFVG